MLSISEKKWMLIIHYAIWSAIPCGTTARTLLAFRLMCLPLPRPPWLPVLQLTPCIFNATNGLNHRSLCWFDFISNKWIVSTQQSHTLTSAHTRTHVARFAYLFNDCTIIYAMCIGRHQRCAVRCLEPYAQTHTLMKPNRTSMVKTTSYLHLSCWAQGGI